MTREINWRQGSLVKPEEVERLGLVGVNGSAVMLITHDCDIPAGNKEPILEFIVCPRTKADTNFLNCRNVRNLHIPYQSVDGPVHFHVNYQNRHLVPREQFEILGEPDDSLELRGEDKRVLKQWLCTRYGRPAYPNAFEDRLRKKKGKRTVEWHIAKIIEACHENLCGMFISLGDEKHMELPDGEPYGLTISLVYHTAGGARAREACEAAAAQIGGLFEEMYGPIGEATEVALEVCEAVADSRFSLADIMKTDQWRLEWISLEDEGEFLEVATA
ncbi:hypothetical protein [Pseudomonas sp.]|uniref:hypothetical protein n=1 Tax=Pseudomonas sp. TaxID=306 RepID=UPI00273151B9|nr:hypothetical protein [Pseudomonas sp.]MDP2242584.1 hypothetical protein [Pseudomonas sp.]